MLFSGDSCIRVWNQSGSLLYTFDIGVSRINCATFSRDGRNLIIGSESNSLQLIDLYKDNPPEISTGSHKPSALSCSSDGSRFAYGTTDGCIVGFKTISGAKWEKLYDYRVHKCQVNSIVFHPSLNWVIAGDESGKVSYINIHESQLKKSARQLPKWTSKNGPVHEIDISPHQLMVGIVCKTGFYTYSLENMDIIESKIMLDDGIPTHIKFSPVDKSLVAISTTKNKVYFYSLNLDDNVVDDDIPSVEFKNEIVSISFKHDGKLLAVAVKNAGISIVDVKNLKIVNEFTSNNSNNRFVTNLVLYPPLDINESPKFKQTVVNEPPKITKPTENTRKLSSFSRISKGHNPPPPLQTPQVQEPQNAQNIQNEAEKLEISSSTIAESPRSNEKYSHAPRLSPRSSPKKETQLSKLASPKSSTKEDKKQQGDSPKSPNKKPTIKKDVIRAVGKKHDSSEQKVITKSPPRPPNQTKVPTNAPRIITSENESSSEELELDLSKVPEEYKEVVKAFCRYVDYKNEENMEDMHQHLNTVHLDLLCRIREIHEMLSVIMEKLNLK